MNILEIKKYLEELNGHITFEYNGFLCGVDPLSRSSFDMWYGNNTINVTSIDEVINSNFFDGKSLKSICSDITELDF